MRDHTDVIDLPGNTLYYVRDSDVDRFLAKIEKQENGCWEWTATHNNQGYGQFRIGNFTAKAHRISYMMFVGPIPDGLELDHLCRNRSCVSPEHLEPVTSQENTLRSPIAVAAINAAKTHCLNGHEFTPENTYMQGKHLQNRGCRECQRNRQRAWNANKRKAQKAGSK